MFSDLEIPISGTLENSGLLNSVEKGVNEKKNGATKNYVERRGQTDFSEKLEFGLKQEGLPFKANIQILA